VTVRVAGRSATFPSGEAFPNCPNNSRQLKHSPAEAARPEAGAQGRRPSTHRRQRSVVKCRPSTQHLSTHRLVREREADFAVAVASRDMALAAGTVLDLERERHRVVDGHPCRRELDRAHASLRSLILELGRLSGAGFATLGGRWPFVETLLELRNAARQERRFAEADLVRERLAESGIEVRDTPDGSEWLLAGEGTAGTEAGA